jgi:molybdenum cofactor cytidylyltransferase
LGKRVRDRRRVAAIVLAAGLSSRMGRVKPLLELASRPLLEYILETLDRAGIRAPILVLGHGEKEIRRRIDLEGVRVVVNPDYAAGMSTSLRMGVAALRREDQAFLVVLCDQPLISPSTIDALVAHWASSAALAVIPLYRGMRGNPVLLDRSLVPLIEGISGDSGMRGLLGGDLDVAEVAVDDPGVVIDLDTPEEMKVVETALARGLPLSSIAPGSPTEDGKAL